jgi:DNA-binding CsgD family transcriptional regulator
VLVLDDAQLLDAQSAAVLLSLIGAKSLRLLGTMRSGSTPSDAVTALWKEQFVERLDLSPLDLPATRELLQSLLGGTVASSTVEMLWSSSRGNPFYLTELARFGAANGQLETRSGVWWWLGGTDMPPRLGELLDRRIKAVSPAGQEAIEFLALGEPLPYATLSAVVSEDAILELDQSQIITSDEHEGILMLRFAHPLLHTVAAAQLSATRRRSLAARLRAAPADHVDLVRRATWEEAAGDAPNLDLLLAAADSVLLNDAETATRLATRAVQAGGGVRATTMLAAAQSEGGRPDLARATLTQAAASADTEEDHFTLLFEDFSLALWGERSPSAAGAVLDRMRQVLPDSYAGEVLAAEALLRLFSGRCRDAIELARSVPDGEGPPRARIRALTALTGALTFADRGAEAIRAGQQLLDALIAHRVPATQTGLAYALIATTGLFFGAEFHLPRAVGPLGRWPGMPERLGEEPRTKVQVEASDRDEAEGLGWPFLVGVRRHLRGDLEGALAPLREAFVQQQSGEGRFRSEATAELIFALCECGLLDEAAAVLRDHPPDDVAIIPGLRPWSEAAVAAAAGHHGRAGDLAIDSARAAAAGGCGGMAMSFLVDAGRYGHARRAAEALPELGVPLDTDMQRVRAADVAARASSSPGQLLDAADVQLEAGFLRHCIELAELARQADRSGAHDRRIAALLRQARERLGEHATAAGALRASSLTLRETEVARLASRGLSDRDIAAELVLSVRTVQSHLASAYRKLGIGSRTELAQLYG